MKGHIGGATVRVFADEVLLVEELAILSEASLTLPDDVFLSPGQAITAAQAFNGSESIPSPDPVIVQKKPAVLSPLVFDSTSFECGGCVRVSGAVPGVLIELEVSNGDEPGPRGSRTASSTGRAKVNSDPSLKLGEQVLAHQLACDQTGPDSPMYDVLDLNIFEFVSLEPPKIETPVRACQHFVKVLDVYPGARVVLERSGGDVQTCFPFHDGRFIDISPLVEGESLAVSQSFPGCDVKTASSDAVIVEATKPIPAPKVIGDLALCKGTTSIMMTGLIPGASIKIFVDGHEFGITDAPYEEEFAFPVPPVDGAEVTAQQGLCGVWSPLSTPVKVFTATKPIPAPAIVEPIYECGGAVTVEAVKHAWVKVYSSDLGAPIGEAFAGGRSGRVVVEVNPLLIRDDKIFATVQACGGESKQSEKATVQEIPAVGEPQITPYPTAGMKSVAVQELVPGAYVEVFVNGLPRGARYTGGEKTSVPITGQLVVDDIVAARQRLCTRLSDFGANMSVVPPPPVAMFAADPQSGEAPLMVGFTNHSTGTIDSYAWFFNWDPDVGAREPDSVLENPVNIYEDPGVYTVRLEAYGPKYADSSEQEIEVLEDVPDRPPRPAGASSVTIFNCMGNGHALNIWVTDLTGRNGLGEEGDS